MAQKQETFSVSQLDELHTAGAGYDVLRYISLPEVLGRESNTLLYFMGRNLARKLDIKALEDIYYIFDKLGWGNLELIKEKRKELVFHLMADAVVQRLNASFDTEFRLESGFLAESIQMINERECECVEAVNHKIHQIEFTVVYNG
ncbi:YslB family protein [Virgibacillus sp. NKC19-16]|uniref:YslB family protein n=1 Tax=Virgibacillus salidurans TaxID=2831673 RepID=UPI001F28B242|nr:YslB family protein [Virgibacillus sp. NKC19-16]UJL45000.1 YslB family protein [Virgibacillus sp. NKC19-16]